MADNEIIDPNAEVAPVEPAPIESDRPFEPFTDKQQAKVNQLINETFAKAFTKAEQKWESQLGSLKQDNTELQAQVKTLQQQQQKPSAEPEPKAPKAPKEPAPQVVPQADPAVVSQLAAEKAHRQEIEQAAQALKQERDALRLKLESQDQQSKETRIKEAFLQAAAKIDFYDAMDVFNLVRHEIAIDKETGQIVALNAGGNPRLNSDLIPMTLAQYLSDFAKAKPHMVKAKHPEGGTGSGPSTRVPTEKPKVDYSNLSKDEFNALTSKVIANQGGSR